MGKKLLMAIILFNLFSNLLIAQNSYPYQSDFKRAYQLHSTIPRGLLEAVAYTNTHIRHLTDQEDESCMGLPKYYGVMGLVLDGKGYFRNNLERIAQLSGVPKEQIMAVPDKNIMAYAKAFEAVQNEMHISSAKPEDYRPVLVELNELPLTDTLSIEMQLYAIYKFLGSDRFQRKYTFPHYKIDLETLFKDNYASLSAKRIRLSPDYPLANWDPTTCNFSSRSLPISAVAIHTTQGSYAGTISWFKNCNSSVSAHYVIRSMDGQVTQMVAESDKAWHIGSENSYTIGIEHEGFIEDSTWYTEEMYNASALLVKDITTSGYGIDPLSTYKGTYQGEINSCYRIKGHVHFPNQTHTDPGIYWNWQHYYDLINDTIRILYLTDCSGDFIDSGGEDSAYSSFERYITVIEPDSANSITMNFTVFNLEEDYDFLYIFDGSSINAPLIGAYTGTNLPGAITSSSGQLAILFESDCLYNEDGWVASWTCNNEQPASVNNAVADLSVNIFPNPTKNVCYLEFKKQIANKDIEVKVFNVLGQQLSSSSYEKSSRKLNFEHYGTGIYQILITTENNQVAKKILVIR